MRIIDLGAALGLWVATGAASAQSAECANLAAATATTPTSATIVAPVAPELTSPSHPLGTPSGVLAQALDEALSVDQVLLRLRIEGCQVAKALPAAPGSAAPLTSDPAGYKPRTQFDNAPWRFDMNQGGKRMTADEFDAWMKSRGVRVARGSGTAAAAAPASPPPPTDAPKQK